MENQLAFNQNQSNWIYVDSRNTLEIDELIKTYELSDEMLVYALDKNERARVEYDVEHEALLVVYNVPVHAKQEKHYVTHPVTFIIKKNYLFTFFAKETEYVIPLVKSLIKQNPNQTQLSLLFHSLFLISDSFFPLIEEVNNERIQINEKLRRHTTNKHLLALSDLSIGQVYLVTGTKQNVVLLETMKALEAYRKMSENEKEELDDALIEAKQAAEMAQLAAQILEQLSNTYNNLLNNNLNDTMKLLTIWSLILTVPTIVTGFFGMNMSLPFDDSIFSWVIAIVISLVLSVWLLFLLWRRFK